MHVVSPSEFYFSTWRLVDPIHLDKNMSINFTVSHEKQRHVANGFKNISTAEHDICDGCADGLLIWTFNPNGKDSIVFKVGLIFFTME